MCCFPSLQWMQSTTVLPDFLLLHFFSFFWFCLSWAHPSPAVLRQLFLISCDSFVSCGIFAISRPRTVIRDVFPELRKSFWKRIESSCREDCAQPSAGIAAERQGGHREVLRLVHSFVESKCHFQKLSLGTTTVGGCIFLFVGSSSVFLPCDDMEAVLGKYRILPLQLRWAVLNVKKPIRTNERILFRYKTLAAVCWDALFLMLLPSICKAAGGKK